MSDDFFSSFKKMYQDLGAYVNNKRQTVHEKEDESSLSSDGTYQQKQKVTLHTLGCSHYSIPHGECTLCRRSFCKECARLCAQCGVVCCSKCSSDFTDEKMTLCEYCAEFENLKRSLDAIESDIKNWRLF